MLLQQHIQERVQDHCEKHEHIDLIPAEVANIGVRVACAEDISDFCQSNAAVMLLQVDLTKCTAEGPGVKVAAVGKACSPVHCPYSVPKWPTLQRKANCC